jgi:hypothetical protein
MCIARSAPFTHVISFKNLLSFLKILKYLQNDLSYSTADNESFAVSCSLAQSLIPWMDFYVTLT